MFIYENNIALMYCRIKFYLIMVIYIQRLQPKQRYHYYYDIKSACLWFYIQ